MGTQNRVKIYSDDTDLSFQIDKEKESTMSSVQYFVLFSLEHFLIYKWDRTKKLKKLNKVADVNLSS